MENIQLLSGGFSTLFTLSDVGVAMMGAVLGLIVGIMPGIGSLAGVVLLLPLTYKFNPTTAIIILGALYYSNTYSGAFNTILLNIPGSLPAIYTTTNDYPMAAKKKHPDRALSTVNMASFTGGTISIIILTFTGPALANVELKFGPSEMTALLFIAMTPVSWLVSENPIKGVVIAMLEVLLAGMGMDTLSGSPRYDFGSMYLLGGIPLTPFIVGIVGFSQVISLVMEWGADAKVNRDMKLTIESSLLTKHDLKRFLPSAIRSGLMGTFVGVLPGTGAATDAFMEYATQKKFENEEELGTGVIEGIAAAETANDAAAAEVFTPLLALRVPGGGTRTVLLGRLMVQGLNPGPLLFTNEPEFTQGLIASLSLSNIFTLIVSAGVTPSLIKILSVPVKFMIPIIITMCVVRSYSPSYSVYGMIVMFLSNMLGYIFTKSGFPTTPMLLSFVLAKLLESNMRKVFMISGGSLDIFFVRPITCVLMLIFLASIFAPVIKATIRKVRSKA